MTHPGYQPLPGDRPHPGDQPQPAYGSPGGYGGSGLPPATPRPARKNTLGVVALVVGAAISVLQLVFQFVSTAVIVGRGPIQLVSTLSLVITGLLAIVALGLGIAGLLQKGAPKAAAGAGTALGAAALFGVVTSALTPFIFTAFY